MNACWSLSNHLCDLRHLLTYVYIEPPLHFIDRANFVMVENLLDV